jgi:radical SAM superfamily enzyme YgiQ (UPF0313 family)
MTDIVLFSVPPIFLQGPHLAPAILKSYAAQHGFQVKCLNPSQPLHDSLPEPEREIWPYNDFESFYRARRDQLEALLEKWCLEIHSYQPRYLGLSTHAWSSLFFLKELASYFKRRFPDIPIVMGGPPSLEIGQGLLDQKIIDYFVGGDGEQALLSILQGDFKHPNINCKSPVGISNSEFNNLPIPDFSDAQFEKIKERYPKSNKIYLISSRGCVFNCSFCNVPYMTEKYRYKDGSVFAEEVLSIQKQYGPKTIELADSLINGSMKIFRDFLTNIIDIKKTENVDFNFDAFFRIRPETRMRPEDFKLSAQAGLQRIRIGVESGSANVRQHIGKRESDDDIFYTLEMCKKFGIAVNLLILVGYVNESKDDFKETMDFLNRVRDKDLDLIVDTVVVNELYISKGTKLYSMIDELGVRGMGGNNQKSQRQWEVTLENGEVIDSTERNKRVGLVKEYVKENYRAINKVIVSSKDDESCEFQKPKKSEATPKKNRLKIG